MYNYHALIGIEKSSDLYQNFEKYLNDTPINRENNISTNTSYDLEILYKNSGILVTFLEEKVIGVKVYFSPSPIALTFKGEFVYGLSHISSENDIRKQFNFPKNLNIEPMRSDNLYQYENCTVAFDAMTGEINYAEIR